MLVIVLSMALFDTMLLAPITFRYRLASIRSMSYLFHTLAAIIGVPIKMSRDLARQHIRC